MLNIALPALAVSVSAAGGLGFLAAGYDVSSLERNLEEAARLVAQPTCSLRQTYQERGVLPLGVGFLNWGADLERSLAAIEKYKPCAVWLFGPKSQPHDLVPWADRVRAVAPGQTQIWVQVGTVGEAVAVAGALRPDVLVVQGSDAGGHGLARSASIVTLLPEGYRAEVLSAADGGVSTVRSTVYDRVRGIYGWPERYDGRGVINQSYVDAVERGMSDEENRARYESELQKGDLGWGPGGRLTTYAGTGVGLVRETIPAAEIVQKCRQEAMDIIQRLAK
ncbi:conserved hypothetical protein [Aspergillus terreus NIH2624]|uniref:Nitronate monooxygenase domain-containing protein n=1 Tax=Aspergillus terreus (strain NIH 2624 / FGSC A1156) TaxID=341663 RepID=Q0CPW5_ASPTN|nr:uncharacterized protein ATEG_04269 [Aspergillus terreus NIH2624]EAU34716.1 conserved hypothetical protein [Aspergillus terreus NIH2624]